MRRVVEVRREAERVVVVLRPYGLWETIAFPVGMLAALGIVASVLDKPYTRQDRVVFHLIWLGAGLVLGALASLVAYLLVGREEIVTVSGGRLVIDRQVLRHPELRRRRTYATDRIVNLRAVGPAKPPRPWLVNLAFDCDGSTVRFGTGVGGPDADHLLKALAAAMPATAQDPARRSAADAVTSGARAWSRVTLLVAAVSLACLVAVILAWPLDPTKMTPGLAIAIVGAGFIPAWAFVVWILESRVPWRSRIWVRLASILYLSASLLAATYVLAWVSHELLSPFRPVGRGDLNALWGLDLFLLLAGMFWATHRADKRGWRVREERGVSPSIGGR